MSSLVRSDQYANAAGTGAPSFPFGVTLAATDIPALDWSKITTGKPTTLGGFGIGDAYTKTAADARYAPIAVPFASLTGLPATLAGHGIADAAKLAGGNTLTGAQILVPDAIGTKPLVVKAFSAGQTANLFEARYFDDSALLMSVSPTGAILSIAPTMTLNSLNASSVYIANHAAGAFVARYQLQSVGVPYGQMQLNSDNTMSVASSNNNALTVSSHNTDLTLQGGAGAGLVLQTNGANTRMTISSAGDIDVTTGVIKVAGTQVLSTRGASVGADATDLATVLVLANALKARLSAAAGGHGLIA